jgi:asparagine synthase (glutamine-hydrolysing)
MCGIAGSFSRHPDARLGRTLVEMAGELAHRGPDGSGLYLDGEGRFGMVNTRLAVVDLEGGDQPLSDESGRFWVMQNGEVYNYVELRDELAALGHRFETTCDTEVIAHAFEEWGPGCLERLNGDFAIAVWDSVRRELFLARDRFGVRPLFLSEQNGDLLFASEIKALLRHPRVSRELDPSGLVESFVLWSISPERSAFRGVRELPPAHYLRMGADGSRSLERWWDLDLAGAAEKETRDLDELAEELRLLLEDSVRLRLRADVEVGGYLSGGLDSSAIAALASKELEGGLVAFGIGFADERFDERLYQERIARELGTNLHRIGVGAREIGELFPRAIVLAEQPSLRTALVPMLHLSRLVHDHGLKVVLTGEGADELFAGYDIFREAKLRRFWARDPSSRLRPLLFARIHRYLLHDLADSGAVGQRFFAHGLEDTSDPLYSHRLRFRSTERILRLFSVELLEQALAEGGPTRRLEQRLPKAFSSFTALAQAQYLEIASFFEGYLLHAQGDRMLMGNSIEGRFPYLDYRVAEFAAGLGDSAKLRGLREKDILRRSTARFLPAEIVIRAKRPYRAPIVQALAGPEAPGYVEELMRPERLRESGVLSPEVTGRVLHKCRENAERGVGEIDEMALAGAVSVMLLYEHLVANPVLAGPVEPVRTVVGRKVASPGTMAASGLGR